MDLKNLLARIAYGAAFCIALPLAMVLLARRLDAWVVLPLPGAPAAGLALLAAGLALMAWAMAWLAWRGGGLPMNAFPPPRRVSSGPYALVPHPIYTGFVLAWAGGSLRANSPGGFWILSPLAALGCAALVWGYERPDLLARFGEGPRPWLSLAGAGDGRPSRLEALGATAFTFILWLLAVEGVRALGSPPDARATFLPGEAGHALWPWTRPLLASVPVALVVAPFLARRRDILRRFGIQGLLAVALCTLLHLSLPFEAPPGSPAPAGRVDALMGLERVLLVPTAASFPALRALWALLAADLLAARGRGWTWAAWAWALAAVASGWTTGLHTVVDLAAAGAVFLLVRRPAAAWASLRRVAERLSNGWREWRFGPVRIINHGLWAGLAGFSGALITAWLSGALGWSLFLCVCGLLGAALWAQLVEGSPALLRPFGYFGTLAAVPVAALAIHLAGGPALRVAAAFAVAGPCIQALGRLRCLVQGCCHGRPAPEALGIRVREPHSRVCKLAHLVDVPIHPTPLYSILGNLALGPLLLRAWWLGLPQAFIGGTYLAVAGCLRFAEEAYRGEPQTRRLAGLSLYQWLAAGMVAAGCTLMALPSGRSLPPAGAPDPAAWVSSTLFGLLCAASLGLDFPESGRRFARLSG